MIFVVEDDKYWGECIGRYLKGYDVQVFRNGLEAAVALNDGVPDAIILDILLDGPNGFTFLNELQSYEDTGKVPVVVVSSLDFGDRDMSEYGVVKVIDKSKMMPQELKEIVKWIYEQKR